jgi:hypothetical protein
VPFVLQVRHYDAELETCKQVGHEESSSEGSRLLAYLPGAILVNKEPLEGSPWPDLSPNRITRAVLSAAYGLLQVRGLGRFGDGDASGSMIVCPLMG